jgi:hypothetical protein
MNREQRNADIILAYLGGATTREAGEQVRPRGRPAGSTPEFINDTAQSAAVRLTAADGCQQLHKRTLTALHRIAKVNVRPIGMTMAMCGLNPESRAVVLGGSAGQIA